MLERKDNRFLDLGISKPNDAALGNFTLSAGIGAGVRVCPHKEKTMSRKGFISIGAVVLLLLVAAVFGYFTFKTTADDALVSAVETYVAELPAGVTLTYDSLSSSPISASVEMKNAVYTNLNQSLKVTADSVVVGVGSLGTRLIDVQLKNAVASNIPPADGAPQGQLSAKAISVKAIDLDWFGAMSSDVEDDDTALFDVDRWRTFNLGPVVVESLAFKADGDEGERFSIAKLEMGGVDAGVLRSVSLSRLNMVSGQDTISLDALTQEQVDIAWTMGLVGDLRVGDDPGALFSDRWAGVNMGPSTMSNLVITSDGDKSTLESSRSEGIKNGRVGTTVLTNLAIDEAHGSKVTIGTYTYDGIDLARAMAFVRAVYIDDELPNLSLWGVNEVSMENISIIPDSHEKVRMTVKRVALIDVKENAAGMPLAATFVVDGFDMPLTDMGTPQEREMFANLGLKTLKMSGKLAVAFEEESRRLTVNPLSIDLGDLGSAQATVDVSGFDSRLLAKVSQNPTPFMRDTILNGVTLTLKSGSKTEKVMDFYLKENGMTRDGAVTSIRKELTPQLVKMLGNDLGGRISGAVASFVEQPGTLGISIKAKNKPTNLKDFSLGLMMAPQDVSKNYAIDVDYKK